MALQQLRSSTANKRPTAGAMSDGQLAVNTNATNPGLFFKDADGSVRKVGPVFIGSAAPNASPATGGSTGHSVGEQWLDNSGGTYVLKIWDGTAWRSESGTFVDVNGDTMTGVLEFVSGSASAPGIAFSGDTNTGIFRPGADSVAVATGGTQRIVVDSSGNVGIGTASPTVALDVSGDVLIEDTSADSAAGPEFSLYRNSASPADGDYLGQIRFDGENDTGGKKLYAKVTGKTSDVSAGSEDGLIETAVIKAGSQTIVSRQTGDALKLINGTGLQVDGDVGIGTTSANVALSVHRTSENAGLELTRGTVGSEYGYRLFGSDGATAPALKFFPVSNGTLGSEKMRIDSAGRLLLGTTTEGHGSADDLTIATTGDTGITIRSGTSDQGNIFFSDGTSGTNEYKGAVRYYHNLDELEFMTAASGRMRIDSSGNVGIGTTSPNSYSSYSTLTLNGSSGGEVDFETNNTLLGQVFSASSGFHIRSLSSTPIIFKQDSSERLRIDSSGNIGIGTSSPGNILHVHQTDQTANSYVHITHVESGSGATDGLSIGIEDGGVDAAIRNRENGYLRMFTNNTERLRIDSSGNVGIGVSNISGAGSLTLLAGQSYKFAGSGGNTIYGDISADTSHNITFKNNNGTERLRIDSSGRLLVGTATVPTGLVLGNSLTAASSTGAEVVAFRSDTSVAVGDVCGAFVIGNSDTDGAEDHFVGMWGKAISTNGSMDLHFAAGRASYEGDTPDVTIQSGGNVGIGNTAPAYKLSVLTTGTTDTSLHLATTGGASDNGDATNSIRFTGGNNTRWANAKYEAFAHIFNGNGVEQMRIDSSGRLLVGATSVIGDSTEDAYYAKIVVRGNTASVNNSGQIALCTGAGSATLTNGERIGRVVFADGDGGTFGLIDCEADGTAGANDYPGRLVFRTTADGSASPTERMRIDSSGNVGIGTQTPDQLLHLESSSSFLAISNSGDTGDAGLLFRRTDNNQNRGYVLYDFTNDALKFRTSTNGAGESMRIDSSGRLLVGTTTNKGTASVQALNTGTTSTSGNLTLTTASAQGGDAPNSPYAVTRAVYGSACTSGGTETIRTLASTEIAFIKIFYSWPSGSPNWKTGAYTYNGSTVSTTWFHESNSGHAFTLGVSGGVLTLTQSVGVTMNMVIEIEYMDSSGLD